jgi:hypothetical protein
MRFDVSVHSPRIRLEVRAILCWGNLKRFLRRHLQPQNPLLTIMLEKGIAQNLGNFAGGEAPHHVHLPQAVLRSDVSLRKGRRDSWPDSGTPSVTNDCTRRKGRKSSRSRPVGAGQNAQRNRTKPAPQSASITATSTKKNSPHAEAGAREIEVGVGPSNVVRSARPDGAGRRRYRSGFPRSTDSMVGAQLRQMHVM